MCLRATRGMLVEVGSPHYTKYTLGVFYNLADFADDPELARLAREFLDLFWTQFALEQIEGSRGGSRHRSKAGQPSIIGGDLAMTWYHFGLGSSPELTPSSAVAPALLTAATTSYVPDPVAVEILKHRTSLGEYEMISRLPGRMDPGAWPKDNLPAAPVFYVKDAPGYPYNNNIAVLDAGCGATLRKTYAAPGFIVGTTMEPTEPFARWAGFSTSYRWDGVLFAGPCTSVHPVTKEGRPRIFMQPQASGPKAHYNDAGS